MGRALKRDPAEVNFSPESLYSLLDFPARASITTQSSGPGLASILYAEDDSAQRGLSVEILTHSGYAVTPVQDGHRAWAALQSERYDLLITDNSLPGMSGLELAEKTRLEGMRLPIIVASGDVAFPSGAQYGRLCVAARLQKPFATELLLSTVREVLRATARLRQRGDIFFPAPTQNFSDITPYQHWGLNE